MRIDAEEPVDEKVDPVERGVAPTIGLWGPLYFALWLTGFALAVMTTVPRAEGWRLGLALAGWAGGLGLAAMVACQQRLPLMDLLSGLLPRERVMLSMLIGAFFFGPSVTDHFRVLVDGWLWAGPLLLMLAVTPLMTRIYLACMLAGAWMAAATCEGEPYELAMVLAFGLSWLLAIGAVHFAYTGDPHGLAGWWPIYRLAMSVAQAALPAGVAAVAIWLIWPPSGLHRPLKAISIREMMAPTPAHPVNVQALDLTALIWHVFVAVIMIFWLIWVMLYLRKIFGRRTTEQPMIDLMPEQSARMEYRAATPPKKRPTLAGARGEIVALWAKWSQAVGREASERREAETAREFTGRIANEMPAADPGPEMTRLLEKAHYAPEEPSSDEIEEMRRMVETELSKQSIRRQAPME